MYASVDDWLKANEKHFGLPQQSSQVARDSELFTIALVGELLITFPTNTTHMVRRIVVGTAKIAVPTICGNRSQSRVGVVLAGGPVLP